MKLTFLVSDYSSLGSGLELLKLILICVVVIAASYYVSKKIGASQLGMRKDSNFKIIDALNLGNGKYLQIIKIGMQKYVVIAVSKEKVNLITELSEEEIIEQQRTASAENGFKSILMRAIKKDNDRNISINDREDETDDIKDTDKYK